MNIVKEIRGTELKISLEGRLDTNSSPQLEAVLKQNIDGMNSLIFDLEKLEYISSAGLRVLLNAQKVMNRQGDMVIKNSNEEVMEVFDVTGFVDILDIE